MASKYFYHQTIRNEFLGVHRVIRAASRSELEWLVQAQLTKWADQETRKKEQREKQAEREAARQHVEDLKLRAEENTQSALEALEPLRNILTNSVVRDLRVNWYQLMDHRAFPSFTFNLRKPTAVHKINDG